MKEIRMPFEEYEKMVELIQTQQNQIDEFKKGGNIVIVDDRYDYAPNRFNWFCGRVPKVIGDETKAKEMLQTEFNHLHDDMKSMQEEIRRLQKEQKPQKKRWWE
jgi:pyruvate/2-oxoacid:ferredoxin oxidoreductase beta subunit